jgi:hypothetical protein
MKIYQTPLIEVANITTLYTVMDTSPSGNIQGTPGGGLNGPGGKGAPARPF